MKKVILSAVMALTIGLGISSAQTPSANDWHAYDTNRDGHLDDNEWNHVKNSWYPNSPHVWNQFDKTGDGYADYREREQARLDWAAANGVTYNYNLRTDAPIVYPSYSFNRSSWYRYDTNRDGRIDANEWRLLRSRWNTRNWSSWNQFDTNNDGVVDAGEARNVLNHWNTWSRSEWRNFDTNHDGRLSRAERRRWERSRNH